MPKTKPKHAAPADQGNPLGGIGEDDAPPLGQIVAVALLWAVVVLALVLILSR